MCPDSKNSLGLYYGKQASIDNLPKIVICVGNICKGVPRYLLCIGFLRRFILAQTLFHEIGHHIQYSVHGIKKHDGERHAKQFTQKMLMRFGNREFFIIKIILYPIILLSRIIRRFRGSVLKAKNA